MKGFIAAFSRALVCLIGLPTTSLATTALVEADSTAKWTYPYTAPDHREKHIRDGIRIVLKDRRGTSVSKFVDVLGPADQVDDLRKGFEGMSVEEDGMLSRYRPYLSYRLVWYITKQGATGHSSNDVWFAAYVGNGGDGVFKVVANNIQEAHP